MKKSFADLLDSYEYSPLEVKGSFRNKVGKIAVGFLSPDKTSKRSNAMCLASFDNEVWWQKDKARCKVYSVTNPKETQAVSTDRIKELTMNKISAFEPISVSIPTMRKSRRRFTVAAAAAIICILAIGTATALALTNAWGIMDFLSGKRVGARVLPEASGIIQTDIQQDLEGGVVLTDDSQADRQSEENRRAEAAGVPAIAVTQAGDVTELGTFSVREAIFDSLNLYIIVEVKPARPDYLLLGSDTMLNDPISGMGPLFDGMGDTVEEYASKNDMILISTGIGFDAESVAIDWILEADGTLVYMLDTRYISEEPQVTLEISCTMTEVVNGTYSMEDIKRGTLTITLQNSGILDSVSNVSIAEYSDCGLRVDKITLIRTPMEIYAEIEYAVTEWDKYTAAAGTGDIRFEFIDENGEWLPRGASYAGDSGIVLIDNDADSTAPRYKHTASIQVTEEMPSEITLRAFNVETKDRYEAHTFEMR